MVIYKNLPFTDEFFPVIFLQLSLRVMADQSFPKNEKKSLYERQRRKDFKDKIQQISDHLVKNYNVNQKKLKTPVNVLTEVLILLQNMNQGRQTVINIHQQNIVYEAPHDEEEWFKNQEEFASMWPDDAEELSSIDL